MDAVSRCCGFVSLIALTVALGCHSTENQGSSGSFTPRGFSDTFSKYGQNSTARSQAPDAPATAPISASPIVPAAATTAGPKPEEGTTQIRAVAVIGNDVVITDDEVWQMVRQRAPEYSRLTGPDREAKEKEIFREMLRNLIERELILTDFITKIKKNRPQLVDELQDQATQMAVKQLRDFKKANGITNETDFIKAMNSQGMSPKSLQRQIERNAMMNMYLGQLAKDKVKAITLAQMEHYYVSNPEQFRITDRCKWQHLFVSYRRYNTPDEAKKYMESLVAQIKAGADFVEVSTKSGHGDSALRHGEGAGEKPGEISPRELEPTILALSVGQISNVVATDTGLHVVKVIEREHAGVRPFDEKTQTYIRMKMSAEIQKQEYEKLIEELWRKTTVKIVGLP